MNEEVIQITEIPNF